MQNRNDPGDVVCAPAYIHCPGPPPLNQCNSASSEVSQPVAAGLKGPLCGRSRETYVPLQTHGIYIYIYITSSAEDAFFEYLEKIYIYISLYCQRKIQELILVTHKNAEHVRQEQTCQ